MSLIVIPQERAQRTNAVIPQERAQRAIVGIYYPVLVAGSNHVKVDPDTRAAVRRHSCGMTGQDA